MPARDKRLADKRTVQQTAVRPTVREMPCPMCGHPMPDLKGGKDTICPVCGFKDSCCY
jgi:predicted RNA-binding Zn-ribbon protein involved in translation (DUF1610 family)